jgi:hypothetical protein
MYIENEDDMEKTTNFTENAYEAFSGPIKINDKITHLYEDTISEDLIGYRSNKLLEEIMYNVFLESPFYHKYKTPKRIEKSDVTKMYYFFKEKILKEHNFSLYDIFINFAEFFQINYELLYNEISTLSKEELLKELNNEKQISERFKTKKLF